MAKTRGPAGAMASGRCGGFVREVCEVGAVADDEDGSGWRWDRDRKPGRLGGIVYGLKHNL